MKLTTRKVPRSVRGLVWLLLSLPVVATVLALGYQFLMREYEGQRRTLGESLQWAVATMTTTGFGPDTTWSHAVMQAYVIVAEFAGVAMIFLVFPVFIIPFLEERFQSRLPSALPKLDGTVLIYRFGPEVTSLLEELQQVNVPVVLYEENEAVARRLHEQGVAVVLGLLEDDDADLQNLSGARAIVANGPDEDNAALALSARFHGFTGPILSMVDNPARRTAILRAGATTAFTPAHVLASALAARASTRLSPRISGVRHLGAQLEIAELRVHATSALAGRTISESKVRSHTGATIVGLWMGGRFVSQPELETQLDVGTILVAVGTHAGIRKLSELAMPVQHEGPILVLGHTLVGEKVAEILRSAGEVVCVIDETAQPGVDVVGDPLDPELLGKAGIATARAAILTLVTDTSTLFAAAVVRSLSEELLVVGGALRAENVSRIHRAGADFALSIGQVAGQLLAFHVLGQEAVSLEAQLKLVATSPGTLSGKPLNTRTIREQTGCSVTAVERDDQVHVEFDGSFVVQPGDVVYLCGTSATIAEYFRIYPGAKVTRTSAR